MVIGAANDTVYILRVFNWLVHTQKMSSFTQTKILNTTIIIQDAFSVYVDDPNRKPWLELHGDYYNYCEWNVRYDPSSTCLDDMSRMFREHLNSRRIKEPEFFAGIVRLDDAPTFDYEECYIVETVPEDNHFTLEQLKNIQFAKLTLIGIGRASNSKLRRIHIDAEQLDAKKPKLDKDQ